MLISLNLFNPVANYYQVVNAAQLAIARSDYKHAAVLYDSAFQQQPVPLGQDLFNASVCAVKNRAYHKAMDLCLRLADKGLGGRFFNQKACYRPLRKQPTWENFMQTVEVRSRHFRAKNADHLLFINGLIRQSDQVYRAYQASPRDLYTQTEYRWISDSLSQVLLRDILTSGYSSEEQIGLMVLRDTILAAVPVFYPILHRRPPLVNIDQDTVFQKIFYQQAVNAGKLKPEVCAELVSDQSAWSEAQAINFYSIYGTDLYHSTAISCAQADSIRQNLGMLTVADEMSKIQASSQPANSDFVFSVFLTQQWSERELPYDRAQFIKVHQLAVKNFRYTIRKP